MSFEEKEMENRKPKTETENRSIWPVLHFRFSVFGFPFGAMLRWAEV